MADPELSTAEVLAGATPEEAPLEEGQEQVAAAPETGAPVEPEVDWKSQYDTLQSQFTRFQSQVTPLLEERRRAEAAKADELYTRLESAAKDDVALSDQDKERVRALLRYGAQWEQESPTIGQERHYASAISYAVQIVGEDATIKEWRDVANDLAKLEDVRLMELAVPIMKDRYTSKTVANRQANRQAVAQQRSSIDRVPAAPAQTGLATDEAVLIAKVNAGTATPAEEIRLRQLWFRRDGR